MSDGYLEERCAAAVTVDGRAQTERVLQLSSCASAPHQQLLLLSEP